MASLSRAINWIMRNQGHDIFLQRKNPDNTEFTRQLEKHTVRSMYPNSRGLTGITDEKEEGMVHTVDMIYYFLPNAAPREGDRIYEADERYEGYKGPARPGQTTWLIDYALPLRGVGGKIVFFTVGCTREEPN